MKIKKKAQNKKFKIIIKWLVRILSALVCLAIAASISLWIYLRSTVPDWSGKIEINSLIEPVHIIRDHYGIPHVYAENEEDIYFAAGFIHAQERFFQMDVSRRYAGGRLAELIGRKSVTSDRKMKNLQLPGIAREEWNSASTAVKRLVGRYTDGINYVIENGPVSLEYKLLGCEPEKWEPDDCILVWLAFGWDLSGTGGELTNGVVYNRLGRDWTGFLRDNRLSDGAVINPSAGEGSAPAVDIFNAPAGGVANIKALDWAINKRWDNTNEALPSGSSWVVNGNMTESGKPLLVSDFCLDATIPTNFHTMHISGSDINFTGAFLPGVPFPVMGYNGRIAWGMTPLGADAVDFRELKWKDRKRTKLSTEEGTDIHASSITEKIKIKDNSPKEKTTVLTDFGNCINSEQKTLPPLAVLWTGSSRSKNFDALYRLGKSKNRTEFISAISELTLPHFNVIYADMNGNIGYYLSGRLPDRGEYSGALPLKAGKDTRWKGFIDEKTKPAFFNPRQGYIIAAGNPIGVEGISHLITSDNDLPFRAERIEHLIKTGKAFTPDSMAKILNDTYSTEAETVLAGFKDIKLDNPWLNELLKRLKKWDKRFEGGAEPAIYLAFRQQLLWFVLSDDIREIAPGMTSFSTDRIAPLLRAMKLRKFSRNYSPLEGRNWIDDRRSDSTEDINLILKFSLGATSNYLMKYFTDRWEKKHWEDFHTVDFIHPLWRQGLSEKIFCRRLVGINGGQDTVLNTMWWKNHPFRSKRIPALRMIIDLGDPDNSLIIKNTGQAAHPVSREFTDEMEMFIDGKYKKMLYTKKLIDEEKDDELILMPTEMK
jgi:penicillin amidase